MYIVAREIHTQFRYHLYCCGLKLVLNEFESSLYIFALLLGQLLYIIRRQEFFRCRRNKNQTSQLNMVVIWANLFVLDVWIMKWWKEGIIINQILWQNKIPGRDQLNLITLEFVQINLIKSDTWPTKIYSKLIWILKSPTDNCRYCYMHHARSRLETNCYLVGLPHTNGFTII